MIKYLIKNVLKILKKNLNEKNGFGKNIKEKGAVCTLFLVSTQ